MQWLLDVLAAWADDVKWVHFLTIPVFTGVIGWLINWSGLWMLFSPVRFHGVRVPGMRELVSVLPRKVQEVPGLLQGGLGWQGIIPARAAKMGSIAVDKAIAKLGTPAEFYQQLEPDQIAEHIVTVFRPELPELVDGVMRREHPRLWRDLPGPVRRAVVERVDAQLPTVVGRVTTEIGTHIDQLLDPKIMVIDHFRDNPSLVVRIFRDFGQRELNLMVTFGFVFGFLLGIPVAVVDSIFGLWWLLPVLGVVVGWITNALGMWLIFEPPEPRRILGVRVHGLFPRRQPEAAEVYARIIADDVITLERIGDFLLDGPRGDRTRAMLATALRPAIDLAVGPARGAVRVAVGSDRFDTIRDSVAQDLVGRTLTPFRDKDFSARQAEKIRVLVARRTKELPPRDFVEMMRAAIKEDEWMLYAHGAIMGLAGGFLHLWIFGVG
ncbi:MULTISPECIES: hypothetical protein [Nocardioides]|uniref:DUF445 family protein n=2 Tax=Nocardioides kribbensis TaxID=305517 RepID=A0ABV1P092_9ACTN|nr:MULTISPECIES: hypothetical protein [Nocardioides]KQP65799.1 hypothetical protein ASF47_07130 [Nocardioides sp. Leaf285]MCM3516974.1 hypothetical protein [Nocardioides sp. P86]